MLDGALHHHYQNTKWGKILWKYSVQSVPLQSSPETCRLSLKVQWSCSGCRHLTESFYVVCSCKMLPVCIYRSLCTETCCLTALSLILACVSVVWLICETCCFRMWSLDLTILSPTSDTVWVMQQFPPVPRKSRVTEAVVCKKDALSICHISMYNCKNTGIPVRALTQVDLCTHTCIHFCPQSDWYSLRIYLLFFFFSL